MMMCVRTGWARVAGVRADGIVQRGTVRATRDVTVRTIGITPGAAVPMVDVDVLVARPVAIGMTHAGAATGVARVIAQRGPPARLCATTGTIVDVVAVALAILAPHGAHHRVEDSGAMRTSAHVVDLGWGESVTHAILVARAVDEARQNQRKGNSPSPRAQESLPVCLCWASRWHLSFSWLRGQHPKSTTLPPCQPAQQLRS